MEEFKTVRELYEAYFYGDHLVLDSIDNVELEGWIRTNRDNGSIGFIEFNDGTYFCNWFTINPCRIIRKFRIF